MTIKSFTRRSALALATAGLFASASATALFAEDYSKDNPLKVVFVVPGNLGDKSFYDSAAAGLNKAAAELPITLKIIETGEDQTSWQPALADVSEGDFDVIISGPWTITGFVAELAPQFPEKKYIIFDDAPDFKATPLPNVLGVTYRTSTAGYLAGFAAAKLSKSGVLGEILGMEIAPVLEFAVGFEQGAKAANPDVRIVRAVSDNFADPAKGKEIALAQMADGADVIFPIAGGTGVGALQAVRDAGKLAVGVDSDQAAIFEATDKPQADVIFTSVEKKVGQSLYDVLTQTIAGTAPYGSALTLGLAENAVGISKNAYYEAKVPAELRSELDAIEAKIISGEIKVDTAM